MSHTIQAVILPSETQTREFDAKLLLACFLANNGVPVYVGARHEIHANIHHFPPSLYVAKDFRKPSLRIFEIMEKLGHPIIAWDEEALQMVSPKIYYQRRVTPRAIAKVQEFYAWGPLDKRLIEQAPGFPGTPVHSTGNPRIDLLRPELRDFHSKSVQELQARFGKFILINSSFGAVNPAIRSLILRPGETDERLGHKATPELDDILRHRAEIFQVFLRSLIKLAQHFPEQIIIVRPHPGEDHQVWKNAAAGAQNIAIIHEGSVIPWLLAAQVMIHNSCTTGLESFILGRPSILYEPREVKPTLPTLSNTLSYRIESESELCEIIARCLKKQSPLTQTSAQWDEINKVLSATTGPLASEKIAGHIMNFLHNAGGFLSPPLSDRIAGQVKSRLRKMEKSVNALRPQHKGSKANNLQRYPGLTVESVNHKISVLTQTLGCFNGIQGECVNGQIFRITKS